MMVMMMVFFMGGEVSQDYLDQSQPEEIPGEKKQ